MDGGAGTLGPARAIGAPGTPPMRSPARSPRPVSGVQMVLLLMGVALLLGGSLWLDHKGTPVIATVVRKHEELSVHDSPRGEWSRDYRVGVEFRTVGGAIGSSSVRVARDRFDSLHIGDHISIRYLPALPHYARMADRSTARVLREALTVFLDDSFLTPLLAWLVIGAAALWMLAQISTAAVFISGVVWLVAARFLLFPTPSPIRLGAAETSARIEDVRLVTKSPSGRYVRTHGSTGRIDLGFQNLTKPYQVVRFRFAVPGRPDSLPGADAVDSASVPGLGAGAILPVRYDPRTPRDARLGVGRRTFRERNRYHLQWPVLGVGALVLLAAALHGSRRHPRPEPVTAA